MWIVLELSVKHSVSTVITVKHQKLKRNAPSSPVLSPVMTSSQVNYNNKLIYKADKSAYSSAQCSEVYHIKKVIKKSYIDKC